MVDARSYITALFDDRDRALEAVSALAALGLTLDQMCIAIDDPRALDAFCDASKTVPLKPPIAEQLRETGVSAERASLCAERVANGDVLLLLPASLRAHEYVQLLRQRGADAQTEASSNETIRIPLSAERLRIKKRVIRHGDVQVRKVVTQVTEHVEIPLQHEELVITRTPPGGEPEVLRIPLSHEEFDVRKQMVVTNEATVQRESTERVEHISEPLRHERLEVQREASPEPQASTFVASNSGKSSGPPIEKPRESGIRMNDTSTEISALFPERISAEAAAQDLRGQGLRDEQLAIRDAQAGTGILEDIKRLFSGNASGESHERGAVLYIREGDRAIIEPTIERYGGRMENSTGTGEDLDGGTMKLHEERLNVTKHAEKEGEVRLTKEVVTTRQEVDVPVKREEVVLTRRRVEQPDEGGEISEGEEIRIPVMRDEVEVEKERITTEEVGVEKRAVESTEHVSATLQKERARLETDGKVGTTLDDRD